MIAPVRMVGRQLYRTRRLTAYQLRAIFAKGQRPGYSGAVARKLYYQRVRRAGPQIGVRAAINTILDVRAPLAHGLGLARRYAKDRIWRMSREGQAFAMRQFKTRLWNVNRRIKDVAFTGQIDQALRGVGRRMSRAARFAMPGDVTVGLHVPGGWRRRRLRSISRYARPVMPTIERADRPMTLWEQTRVERAARRFAGAAARRASGPRTGKAYTKQERIAGAVKVQRLRSKQKGPGHGVLTTRLSGYTPAELAKLDPAAAEFYRKHPEFYHV